jgi:hypothetical protein
MQLFLAPKNGLPQKKIASLLLAGPERSMARSRQGFTRNDDFARTYPLKTESSSSIII